MEIPGKQRVLVARGASAIPLEKLALLANMDRKAVPVADQCDSGFCDDDDESRTKCMEYEKTQGIRSLEEATQNMSIGDPQSENRHPSCELPAWQRGRLPERQEYIQSNDKRIPPSQNEVRWLFSQDEDGDTALHLAIVNMNPRETDAIISVAPFRECLDMYNYLKQTPLHLAAITRQPCAIRKLLQSGASPEIPDRNGKTALHLACEYGDLECVKEITRPLLDRQSSEEIKDRVYNMLDERDYNGIAALHYAVHVSNVKIVEYLASIGASVDIRDGKSGRSSLHHAVETGNFLMINVLLHCHADVNAMTYDECTPLHIAAGRGMESIAALLLAMGADPTLTTYEGESPQMLASTAEICEMLSTSF